MVLFLTSQIQKLNSQILFTLFSMLDSGLTYNDGWVECIAKTTVPRILLSHGFEWWHMTQQVSIKWIPLADNIFRKEEGPF